VQVALFVFVGDTEADVLGDAYEYLIGQFASGAGKKAGELSVLSCVGEFCLRKE